MNEERNEFNDNGMLDQEYEERMKSIGFGNNQPANEFNEYSFQKNAKHYTHDPEEDLDEYNAKLTLLSRNAKKTMTSQNTQGALSFVNEADFSKIKPKMAESEIRENSILKGLKDSNQTLKNELTRLADEKENLERRNKKLLRDLEDLESDSKNREKWRSKFLEMEENFQRLQDQLDKAKRQNSKNEKELKEELEELKINLEKKIKNNERMKLELERLREKVKSSNGELNNLLRDLTEKSGKEGENRNLIKEVIKKVDELSKKSKSIFVKILSILISRHNFS